MLRKCSALSLSISLHYTAWTCVVCVCVCVPRVFEILEISQFKQTKVPEPNIGERAPKPRYGRTDGAIVSCFCWKYINIKRQCNNHNGQLHIYDTQRCAWFMRRFGCLALLVLVRPPNGTVSHARTSEHSAIPFDLLVELLLCVFGLSAIDCIIVIISCAIYNSLCHTVNRLTKCAISLANSIPFWICENGEGFPWRRTMNNSFGFFS